MKVTAIGTNSTDVKQSKTRPNSRHNHDVNYICYKLISFGEHSICRTRLADLDGFLRHQQQHRGVGEIADPDNTFVCDCCEEDFHHAESWKAHLRARFDPSISSDCRSLMLKFEDIWNQHDKSTIKVLTVPEATSPHVAVVTERETNEETAKEEKKTAVTDQPATINTNKGRLPTKIDSQNGEKSS